MGACSFDFVRAQAGLPGFACHGSGLHPELATNRKLLDASGTQPPFSDKVVKWVMTICAMMITDEPLFSPLQQKEQQQHWHEITWA